MNAFIQSILKILQRFLNAPQPGGTGSSASRPAAPAPQPKPQPKPKPKPQPARQPQPESFEPATPEPIPTPAPTPTPAPAQPQAFDAGLTFDEEMKNGQLHAVTVSDGKQEGRFRYMTPRGSWKGWYTYGERDIADFIEKEPALIRELHMSDSAANMLRAVSDNEGKLEAINAYDGAFLSFGIFQWTLGTGDNEGELAALLKRVKESYPATFHRYYGRYGLDIASGTNSIYGYLTLDGERIDTRAKKEPFRSREWVYRFWQAGTEREVQAVELVHALSRLETFYWRWKAHGFPLNEVITSEYGVALLLDNHVNLPALARDAIRAAMTETGLTDPTNWGTAEEQKVLDAYLQFRATKVGRFGPMHAAHKRAERTKRYLDEGLISAERGSFEFSTTGTRGGFGVPGDDFFDQTPEFPETLLEQEGRDWSFMEEAEEG
jgi:hypothetical protein